MTGLAPLPLPPSRRAELETVCVLTHRPNGDGTERTPLAVPGLLVCRGHERRTEEDLGDLPDLWAELAEAHNSWQLSTGYRAPSAERPLPINLAISEHRAAIVERLASWARIIGAARMAIRAGTPVRYWPGARVGDGCKGTALAGVVPAAENGFGVDVVPVRRDDGGSDHIATTHVETLHRVPLPETPDVHVVVGWLALHTQWALAQADYAADYSKALHELTGRAWALLYPRKGDIRTQLPCPLAEVEECPGTLTNLGDDRAGDADDDALPEKITCDTCGYVLPASQWRTYRRQLHKRLNPEDDETAVLVTEDDAILWALAEGHRLTGPTLRQWATRGKITRHTRGTRTLYDLDEVETALLARAA